MSDLITPDTLAATAAIPVVKKALDGLGSTMRRGAGAIAKRVLDTAIANLQIGFAPYLRTSYARCRLVKTLLSQDRPLALLEIYGNLFLQCEEDTLKDDELIETLDEYRRIVITGFAGCGKSMFMKYLTICRFENGRGKIPLFVELRQLNSQPSKRLIAYIHESSASADASVTYHQFDLALQTGGILLILDGFDEIDFAQRDQIARQILDFSLKYPQTGIIVSSRPDDQFSSWHDFYVFNVNPLTKAQVYRLIEKIDYDQDLKGRFLEQLDRHLYDSHKSFLSSPLLSSIMLLTYEYFAEIPPKIHIFYEQAFEALFRRHDAQKSQFVRRTYANLALDDFRNFFAAFCAFSYLNGQFTFLNDDLRTLMTKSLNYASIKPKMSDVLRDLHECLCLLIRDGVRTAFVHRSFQEYFCALFIANYHGPLVRPVLEKVAIRSHDEVMPMLFEMARDKVDREWVIPKIEEITGEMTIKSEEQATHDISMKLVTEVAYSVTWEKGVEGMHLNIVYVLMGKSFQVCTLIDKLYDGQTNLNEIVNTRQFLGGSGDYIKKTLEGAIGTGEVSEDEIIKALSKFFTVRQREQVLVQAPWLSDSDAVFGVKMGPEIVEHFLPEAAAVEFIRSLRSIRKGIEERLGDQDSIVELLCREALPAPKPAARQRRTRKAVEGAG